MLILLILCKSDVKLLGTVLNCFFFIEGMYPGKYIAQITYLSHEAKQEDIYDFFSHCGVIDAVEIIRWFSASAILLLDICASIG